MKKQGKKTLVALCLISLLIGDVYASDMNTTKVNDDLAIALQEALTKHPSIKTKLAELEALGFQLDGAKAGRLPTIALDSQAMTNSSTHGVVRVQQTLWSFGKIEGNIRSADKKLSVGKLTLLQVQRQLMEDTAVAYVNVWGAKKRLEIAELNVAEHDRLYQMILRRQQGGIASGADVRLAFSRLLQAQAQRDQLRGLLEKNRYALVAFTQTAVSANLPVDSVIPQRGSLAEELAIASHSEASTQLRRAELEVVRNDVELRKAELLPTLYFRYEHDIASDTRTNDPERMGIALTGNIEGIGVAGKKRIQAEAARLAAAQTAVNDALNDVKRRVSELMTERSTQQQLGNSYAQAAAEMSDALQSTLRQYDAGRKSWIDVLNFQRELHDTQQQLEVARINSQEIELRLSAYIGQLDQLAEVK